MRITDFISLYRETIQSSRNITKKIWPRYFFKFCSSDTIVRPCFKNIILVKSKTTKEIAEMFLIEHSLLTMHCFYFILDVTYCSFSHKAIVLKTNNNTKFFTERWQRSSRVVYQLFPLQTSRHGN